MTPFQVKLIIWGLGSVGILWVSRRPLRDARSHGFFRFFAWEAILGVLVLNIEKWFDDPFSIHQIISWILLIVSIFMVVEGIRLLRLRGRPDQNREEASLIGWEKTTQLVVTGIYRFIRHPLYSSLLFLAWGCYFKLPSWLGFFLASAATVFLAITARVEEAENIRFFGEAYRDYMRKSKMFVPFVF